MSLWFRRKDKQGRVHYLSVSVPLMVIISIVGLVVSLIMALLQCLR